MGSTQQGGVQLSLSTLIVLIMVLFLTASSGGFLGEIEEAIGRGYMQLDMIMVHQSIDQIRDEGSARIYLNLHNDYRIRMTTSAASPQGPTSPSGANSWFSFKPSFASNPVEQTREIQLTSWWLDPDDRSDLPWDSTEDPVGRICIVKHGRSVDMNAGTADCSFNSCTTGTCDPVPPSANSRDLEDSSSESAVIDGYYCENERWTRERFHERYREQCSPVSGEFVDLNRVACPNDVIEDWSFVCNVKATFNCTAGDTVTFKATEPNLETSPVSRDVSCTGEVQYREVGLGLNISNRGLRHNVNFSVETPNEVAWRVNEDLEAFP